MRNSPWWEVVNMDSLPSPTLTAVAPRSTSPYSTPNRRTSASTSTSDFQTALPTSPRVSDAQVSRQAYGNRQLNSGFYTKAGCPLLNDEPCQGLAPVTQASNSAAFDTEAGTPRVAQRTVLPSSRPADVPLMRDPTERKRKRTPSTDLGHSGKRQQRDVDTWVRPSSPEEFVVVSPTLQDSLPESPASYTCHGRFEPSYFEEAAQQRFDEEKESIPQQTNSSRGIRAEHIQTTVHIDPLLADAKTQAEVNPGTTSAEDVRHTNATDNVPPEASEAARKATQKAFAAAIAAASRGIETDEFTNATEVTDTFEVGRATENTDGSQVGQEQPSPRDPDPTGNQEQHQQVLIPPLESGDSVRHDLGSGVEEAASEQVIVDPELQSFQKISKHRWDGDTLFLNVVWEDFAPTWEPELVLHRDARPALLQYWKDKGGRPKRPDGQLLFDIFAIRGHSPNRKNFLIEWLGYEDKERTWEPLRSVKNAAPRILEEYLNGLAPITAEKGARKQPIKRRKRRKEGKWI